MNTQCVGDLFYFAELAPYTAVALDGVPHLVRCYAADLGPSIGTWHSQT